MRRSLFAALHAGVILLAVAAMAGCNGTGSKDAAALHTRPSGQGEASADGPSPRPAPSAMYDTSAVANFEDRSAASGDRSRESYNHIYEHDFLAAATNPLSTFSIDVDAASYTNVRRMLNEGTMPDPDAVRIEELVNYFTYDYPQPTGDVPFSITTDVAACPWNRAHRLVSIGLQGRKMETESMPAGNLVFLVDVSGSMNQPDKLPLVKSGLIQLVDQLRAEDRVAIVVYAGNAGLVLPSTSGRQKERIIEAIDELQAGGSTAGGAGIQLAYRIAAENFVGGGNNRVILCTDGDFNVGVSTEDELVQMIEGKRSTGIYLTVLGFGTGNLQDSKMEQLADKGNGNYAYIDNQREARRVLVNEMSATLTTIAKDVKIQAEFNPAMVKEYRLVGYENRALAARDFNDDAKDAGELGAGHTVTALYEVVPADGRGSEPGVDPLKYQRGSAYYRGVSGELMTVKLRYKLPNEDESRLLVHAVANTGSDIASASGNLKFAAAVAEWGMLLRGSKYVARGSYADVLDLARGACGFDPKGYRREFIALVEASSRMARPM